MSFPPVHVVDPIDAHTHTIILLHGRGSSGPEFADELSDLLPQFPGVRWIFPTSTSSWSSVFQEEMNEWFDIPSLTDINLNQELQICGLKSAVPFLLDLLEDEIQRLFGISEKVVLGGISQGEATALHVLLCGRYKLGAFVGASGWLPLAAQVQEIVDLHGGSSFFKVSQFLREALGLAQVAAADDSVLMVKKTPVFLGHGTDDVWVDVKLGKQVRHILSSMGLEVQWKDYVGAEQDGHWLKEPEEVDDIVTFLREQLKSSTFL